MPQKVYCKNVLCKYHSKNDVCDTTVKIGYEGKCESFEKGLVYYFYRVWRELEHSNFIDINNLDDDLQIGIYMVCKTYNISFAEMKYGLCRMIVLQDGPDGKPLSYKDIVSRQMDNESFHKLASDFFKGDMPEIKHVNPKKVSQPFGWLSPMGVFTEGDFGEHEKIAGEIIKSHCMEEEFEQWNTPGRTMRDFLSKVKGYCIVHNPSGMGGYVVSHDMPLAKKQKEFLYGYFIDMGDRLMAEQYID